MEKHYQIWVHGKFDKTATVNNPIKVELDIDERSAVSYFSLIKYDEVKDRSLLEVTIDTGRKHQIRRHSASLGFPVVGDRLHGKEGDKENLQLTSYYLSFKCPYTHKKRVFNLLA